MKALIVDDEAHCIETLNIYLDRYCPEVEVWSTFSDGEKAVEAIRRLQPDLIFLDIEMPKMNGFEVLEAVKDENFEVIFTTAYDQFAIKAFKVSATDYLLKPIDKEELKQAVQLAAERIDNKEGQSPDSFRQHLEALFENIRSKNRNFPNIALPTLAGLEMLKTSTIIQGEADGNYTRLHLEDGGTLLVSKTLKEVALMLEDHDFARIHHSHLVNLLHIKRYVRGDGGYVVLSNGKSVNVSRSKKEDLLSRLK
ncbi:MAG: LytTR family DNA-binding domain-containing protein [Bacteroidota bacterium]